MHIHSKEFEQAFAEMEGEEHAHFSLEVEGFTIKGVREQFGALTANLTSEERSSKSLVPGLNPIYGRGSWNRYVVRRNGEVVFSAYHATPDNQNKARRLGFEVR